MLVFPRKSLTAFKMFFDQVANVSGFGGGGGPTPTKLSTTAPTPAATTDGSLRRKSVYTKKNVGLNPHPMSRRTRTKPRTKRPAKTFTSARMAKTRNFVKESSQDIRKFGQIGSRRWMKFLLEELDELDSSAAGNRVRGDSGLMTEEIVKSWMEQYPSVFQAPMRRKKRATKVIKNSQGLTNDDSSSSEESD